MSAALQAADDGAASSQRVPIAPAETAPKATSGKRRLVVMGILAVAVIGGGGYVWLHRGLESTDDAQVEADVVAVPAQASGVVVRIAFADNEHVKAGQLLAELDAAPARARLAQAEAMLAGAEAAAAAAEAETKLAEVSARGGKSVAEASLRGASYSKNQTTRQLAAAQARIAAAEASLKQATDDRTRASALYASGAISKAESDAKQTAFDTAQANLDQARANLAALQAQIAGAETLVQQAAVKLDQSSDVDTLIREAHARLDAANAQVESAKAARDLAKLDLDHTAIRASIDGTVSKKSIVPGQWLSTGQPVAMLVSSESAWVVANFKETQLTRMHPGQSARIEVDAFPSAELTGEVESFSAATGSRFSLLPPDNASGNYTKVVQRVPVRIKLTHVPDGVALRPGMSAVPTIDTRR